MPPDAQWYYRLFGEVFGPVSLDQLRETFQSGTIGLQDDVRRDDSTDWRPLRLIAELSVNTAGADTNIEAPQDNAQWYCKVLCSELGPVSFEELLTFAQEQQLTANDEVKLGEKGKWRRAGSIGRLMSAMPYQPASSTPVTPSSKNQAPSALTPTTAPMTRIAGASTPAPASAPVPTAKLVSPSSTVTQPAPVSPESASAGEPAAVKSSPPVSPASETPKPNDIPTPVPGTSPQKVSESPAPALSAPVFHPPTAKTYGTSVSQNSLGDRLSRLKDDFFESKLLPQLTAVVAGLLLILGGWHFFLSGTTGPKLYAVSGVVTFDNKPLPEASVIFNPADEKTGKLATGRTDDKGYFQLYTDSDSGVLPAQYQVMIIAEEKLTTPPARNEGTGDKTGETPSFAQMPKSLIPEKYTNPSTSGLAYPVEEKSQHFEIKLAKEEQK